MVAIALNRRVASSLLHAMNLSGLVCHTVREFTDAAAWWASRPDVLQHLRHKIQAAMLQLAAMQQIPARSPYRSVMPQRYAMHPDIKGKVQSLLAYEHMRSRAAHINVAGVYDMAAFVNRLETAQQMMWEVYAARFTTSSVKKLRNAGLPSSSRELQLQAHAMHIVVLAQQTSVQ